MPAHKHAALMLQYAQDAQETDKPWEKWEVMISGPAWELLFGHPSWEPQLDYRRKPKTIKVNGFEVPAPLKTMPTSGHFWLALPTASEYACMYTADDMDWKIRVLERGLCHSEYWAAVSHAKAMLGIDPNSGE